MLTICIILIVLLALDLLFTLALRCRKGHRKWEVLKKYRYAHRGYHDKPVVPENSLPAFRRAIERGFGAELDVHLLKDGTLAVFHDSDLKRCANVEGEIEDLTLDELKQLRLEGTDEQIPTFDEVLALFEHETPLIIELKTARAATIWRWPRQSASGWTAIRASSASSRLTVRAHRREKAPPRNLPRAAFYEF